MEITSYKKIKSNLYEVEIDYKEKYKIYDDLILKYELLIYKDIDKNKLERLLKENEMIDAYFKGLKYIGIKMRTEKELREYFKKRELSDISIDYAIKRLIDDGYLNNEKYTEFYIKDAVNLSSNGPRKIEDNLKKLGIPSNLISKYLDIVNNEVWLNRIEKIIDKKAKSNKNSAAIFKNKTYTYLLTLGYTPEQINSIIKNYVINTEDAFKKEADKAYRILAKKYNREELKYKFKSKMYSKGFKSDEIKDYLSNIE